MPHHIIEASRLARLIRIREADLQDLAQERQLPFSMSAHDGLYIRAADLDLWKAAAKSIEGKHAL
jgi:hypothetical protein